MRNRKTVYVVGGPPKIFGMTNLAAWKKKAGQGVSTAPPPSFSSEPEDILDPVTMFRSKMGTHYALHTRNKLGYVQSKQQDFSEEGDREVERLTMEYYSTPEGYSEIMLRAGQQEDSSSKFLGDYYHLDDITIEEWKHRVDEYREHRLTELAELPNHPGDIIDTPYEIRNEFHSPGEMRLPEGERIEGYDSLASRAISNLSEDELLTLRWMTSDGSVIVNRYLSSDKSEKAVTDITYQKNRNNEFYSAENLENRSRQLENMIRNNRLEEKVVVYRGLSNQNSPALMNKIKEFYYQDNDEDNIILIKNSVESLYPVGSTYTPETFSASSGNYDIANKFSSSLSVVMEIKTDQCIPSGAVSSWIGMEEEFIVNRNVPFKVRDVRIEKTIKRKYPEDVEEDIVVIQLEQIDE